MIVLISFGFPDCPSAPDSTSTQSLLVGSGLLIFVSESVFVVLYKHGFVLLDRGR